jgi:hypothetical protein
MNNETNNKCSLCGKDKDAKRKTYYIVADHRGFITTVQCKGILDPKDSIIGQETNETKAKEIAALVAANY